MSDVMDGLPSKYVVLAAAIFSTIMLLATKDTYNPAGAQPGDLFLATTLLAWMASGLAFTYKKLWGEG